MFPLRYRCLVVAAAVAMLAVGRSASAQESKPAEAKPAPSKFDMLIKDKKTADGMWKMYHDDQQLLVHLTSGNYGKEYIVLTSISQGISTGAVLGGMSWGFGDEVLWTFKKVGESVHVIRRNVRFKAKTGTPESDAVKLAYSDSVLYSLPILTTEKGGDLVDVTRIFMSDDQEIGREIGFGFRFASDRSTWSKVKAFPQNVELQVNAVYSGFGQLDTVSDTRGVQVGVHYSISELPSNDYKPRIADDRIGYFLTVSKDFSNNDDDQHFIRYINRWDLQKADADAKLSPPKKPIKFYLEKTVPIYLRPTVRAGIEEWNKAFEKLGFDNAIEVDQQRDSDDFDPEDIRYNTFRWITAEAGFAMGPSRVNPKTGQILDADIIFDASFLRYWKTDYETFTPATARELMGHGPEFRHPRQAQQNASTFERLEQNAHRGAHRHDHGKECQFCRGMEQQMGFAAAAMMSMGQATEKGELPEEFIHQALKEVVMHEVGHTLGLRHNFKASAWKPLDQVDNPETGATEATVSSVMDYTPANITPKDVKQGRYYTSTIGPYDYWAIEYGYKPVATDKELKEIAAKCNEPGHDYATDEDTRYVDSDPLSNRFDLGNDPLQFASRQMKLSNELIPKVLERTSKDGDGYQKVRQAFGMLFREYWRNAYVAARYPGGIHVNRDHKADPNGRAPFQIVDPAKQREAMKVLAETAFGTPTYDHNVLNHLAASRWDHWGMPNFDRLDYPIHDIVLMMQTEILYRLTYYQVLNRLHDNEIKVAGDADCYTLAEHFRTLVDAIFTEWKAAAQPGEYTARKPYVSTFRRNLQRVTIKELAYIVQYGFGSPEDARTLSRMHLAELNTKLDELLKNGNVKLDDYTRAHFEDSKRRIEQVLNSELEIRSID